MIGKRNLLLKVCGLNDQESTEGLSLLNPDFMGFVFYKDSARFNTLLPSVVKNVPNQIKKVGVFVDASFEELENFAEQFQLQALQLHGNEPASLCVAIKKKYPELEIIKAFGLDEAFSFDILKEYESCVDYFLFDTKSEQHGGTGRTFNWEKLKEYTAEVPFFISGGIDIQHIADLHTFQHPQLVGVDINSRFELAPGKKDVALISEFKMRLMGQYSVDADGYFGEFGGAYIPEMLFNNVEELRLNYDKCLEDPMFEASFRALLRDYVGRPSPLFKAERLSKKYGAKIYLKREDLNHTGAHKINNTIGQILLAEQMGKRRIVAETGAGQHGVATATVCALKGLECVVFMGALDIERQAPNVARMKMLGATVVAATSGSQTLKDATNEAMRYWINHAEDTYYIIGSVVGPHPYPDMVARFQSIISEETRTQLLTLEGSELPNYVMACVGGGSNAMGMFYHFVDEPSVHLIAIEAAGKGVNSGYSAATTQLGRAGVLHGSKSLLMQTEDGQVVEPFSISAGLDYPGIGPQHAHLFKSGRGKYVAITDEESMQAGLELTRLEGIIPAIESAHALAYLGKMELKESDVVVVCLSGRGDKDLDTYIQYFNYG